MPKKARSRYGPKHLATVGDLLEAKGHQVYTVAPTDRAADAVKRMTLRNVGALIVLDRGVIAGIFSERDYARKVILKGRDAKDALVRDFMTTDVNVFGPAHTIDDCMALMTSRRVRHIPVVDHHKLIGIISIGDVVNKVISDQTTTIQDLERYITGADYGA